MLNLPTPRPIRLDKISPTLASDLFACPYRVAWRLDDRFRYLQRPTPFAILGVVAHGVAEDVSKGALSGAVDDAEARRRLDAAWDSHVAEGLQLLRERWAPAMPPIPADWPGYQLLRARVTQGVLRAMRARRDGGEKGTRVVLVEEPLEDPENALIGRPDRIEKGPDGVRVVDMKTGVTQSGIRPEQRRQLLLYARLVEASGTPLPNAIAIEDAAGRRWEEAVEPEEIAAFVADVQRQRKTFERTIIEKKTAVSLAQPDAETCRHCPFRVGCSPYWSALQTRWLHGSVAGFVENTHTTAGGQTVTLTTESPRDAMGATSVISALAEESQLDTGHQLCVVDAETTKVDHHFRSRWNTTLSAV